jgi:hypothetical protein
VFASRVTTQALRDAERPVEPVHAEQIPSAM